ncbi:zinc finger protein 112-like isoform X2 [Thalassophryne amazonica]|uniref:zinc finger protein 112-like isoform X2 n=1 Tax=Thalassophryne amazonica TaxID=390379 RepID=UPI0014713F6F|nr:zinc finger protein 112-like isoform X2 [Thalassophryne amazonica]
MTVHLLLKNMKKQQVGVPALADASHAATSGCDTRKKPLNVDLSQRKALLLQVKGRHVVSENCLLQLFPRKCPSCRSELQLEKITNGVVIMLKQQCLQCHYKIQWRSQTKANLPNDEERTLTDKDSTSSDKQAVPEDDCICSEPFVCEKITFSDNDIDPSDEPEEESEEDDLSSDEDWSPSEEDILAEELKTECEGESDVDDVVEVEEKVKPSPASSKPNQLCTECGKFFNKKRHICEHKIKPHICIICGRRYANENALKSHSRVHNEGYEHRCKYCYAGFKTKADKLVHEQTHSSSNKPYQCAECSETFSSYRNRSFHLQHNHSGFKRFTCKVCGLDFRDVDHFQRHMVVHTGLKPYKCIVCQRGFSQSTHLKSHMRVHTGEKPYKCKFCDMCFNHNVSLKTHVQRCHTASSGNDQKETHNQNGCEGEAKESSGTSQVVENKKSKGTEKEEKQKRRRSTGRPKGRPKRSAPYLTEERKRRGPNAQAAKIKVRYVNRTVYSEDESDEEDQQQNDSNTPFYSDEDEDGEFNKKIKLS